jgi:hypothetical protein
MLRYVIAVINSPSKPSHTDTVPANPVSEFRNVAVASSSSLLYSIVAYTLCNKGIERRLTVSVNDATIDS